MLLSIYSNLQQCPRMAYLYQGSCLRGQWPCGLRLRRMNGTQQAMLLLWFKQLANIVYPPEDPSNSHVVAQNIRPLLGKLLLLHKEGQSWLPARASD